MTWTQWHTRGMQNLVQLKGTHISKLKHRCVNYLWSSFIYSHTGKSQIFNLGQKGRRVNLGDCQIKAHPQPLGADPHLPRVSIVITLWFFKQFNRHVTGRYLLSSFTICSARCPVDTLWKNPEVSFRMLFTMCLPLWSQCDCFYDVSSQVATGHILNVPIGFFHNFKWNVPSMYLSHSLRFLSSCTQ